MCSSQCFLCLTVLSTPPTLKLICVLSCQNRLRVWVATVTQMTLSFPRSKWCLLKIQKYSDTLFDRQYLPGKQLKWMLKWVQLNSRLLGGREPLNLRRNCHKMLAFFGCDQGYLVLPVRPSGKTLYSFKPHMWIIVIWTDGGGCTRLPAPSTHAFSACLLFAVLSQERRAQEDLFACLV